MIANDEGYNQSQRRGSPSSSPKTLPPLSMGFGWTETAASPTFLAGENPRADDSACLTVPKIITEMEMLSHEKKLPKGEGRIIIQK